MTTKQPITDIIKTAILHESKTVITTVPLDLPDYEIITVTVIEAELYGDYINLYFWLNDRPVHWIYHGTVELHVATTQDWQFEQQKPLQRIRHHAHSQVPGTPPPVDWTKISGLPKEWRLLDAVADKEK